MNVLTKLVLLFSLAAPAAFAATGTSPAPMKPAAAPQVASTSATDAARKACEAQADSKHLVSKAREKFIADCEAKKAP
jgi:hypothetical protein